MTTPNLSDRFRNLAPGIGVALVVAAAATFLSEHYTAPVMLYALLLGMSFNFLIETERTRSGIEFASKGLLRIGVALLGMRIGWAQITALGWEPVAMVVTLVAVTILVSVALARAMGFNPLLGFLTGGATAICGASAALALSAALPPNEKKEQATLFTVIGVSAFSTLAMIVYPMIAHWAGLDNRQAGVFIGATIHDVAQVVGAGYAISPEAGDTATIVKLLRVAMLLPVILVAGQITRNRAGPGTSRPPLLPWFVVAFVALIIVNSLVTVPKGLSNGVNDLSRWCLVTSITAIGMKTRLGELIKVGLRPVILMLIETVILAAMVLGLLKLGLV
jgi:uncharacterized integral membrane protein (TIGR00698 family)